MVCYSIKIEMDLFEFYVGLNDKLPHATYWMPKIGQPRMIPRMNQIKLN